MITRQATPYSSSMYAGVSFPPRKDGFAGFFAISTDVDLIKESIYVILNTRKGEMPMNPEFGSSAIDLLWEPLTYNSQAILAQLVKADIERWEPRVAVNSVAAYSRESERIIVISATVKSTNQSVTYDYKFAA